MAAEIYWTAEDGDNSDLIPGGITRIVRSSDDLRISFAGRGSDGEEYEGVLRIQYRPGPQTVEGKQNYRLVDEPWEAVKFSVVGDSRTTSLPPSPAYGPKGASGGREK
jgi:hypothetical protein